MKRILIWLAFLPGIVLAQIPDVQIKLDARLDYEVFQGASSAIRWYDPLGHQSLVGLQLGLEPGLRAYVSQRLERIPHDGDPDQLDEYYVEDPGSWRVGKQVLPFGAGMIRESAVGARSDTSLFLREVPIHFALFDSGTGRQRGVMGRLGRRLGFSFADGDHLGISATSMTLIRAPEDSPGLGSGYHRIFGADFAEKFGITRLGAEYVMLRGGNPSLTNQDVLDMSATATPWKGQSFTAGVTRSFDQPANFVRGQASITIYNHVTVEPLLRYRDGHFYDFAVSLHVRL